MTERFKQIVGKWLLPVLLAVTTGCSTMQSPPEGLSRQEIVDRLAVGDPVEIRTGSGKIRAFHISGISDTHIESDEEKYALDSIEIVRHRDVTPAEKGTAVAAALTFVVVLEALFWAVLLGVAL